MRESSESINIANNLKITIKAFTFFQLIGFLINLQEIIFYNLLITIFLIILMYIIGILLLITLSKIGITKVEILPPMTGLSALMVVYISYTFLKSILVVNFAIPTNHDILEYIVSLVSWLFLYYFLYLQNISNNIENLAFLFENKIIDYIKILRIMDIAKTIIASILVFSSLISYTLLISFLFIVMNGLTIFRYMYSYINHEYIDKILLPSVSDIESKLKIHSLELIVNKSRKMGIISIAYENNAGLISINSITIDKYEFDNIITENYSNNKLTKLEKNYIPVGSGILNLAFPLTETQLEEILSSYLIDISINISNGLKIKRRINFNK